MSDEIKLPEGAKLITDAAWGNCKICGIYQDRRFGVCFDCGDHTKTNLNSQPKPDPVEAWDARNTGNRWSVSGDYPWIPLEDIS